MVEARGLGKNYGPQRAVDSVSFSVKRGEVVGFLGPNGAGKSTTMKMLTGYLAPSRGNAFIAGVDVGENPLVAQAKLGYLPESAPMYDDMMVLEFLEFVADLRGVPKTGRREKLRTICARCGLLNVLGKDVGQLSKGYRQRVGLAQALVHDPDLLILDEPTSGLDPNQIVEIRQLIKDLGRDKTILLSTHILPEVQATCDRIIIISDGKLVADATPDALTDGGAGATIQVVVKGKNGAALEAAHIQAMFSSVPGVRNVADGEADGAGTLGFELRASSDVDPREGIFNATVSNDMILVGMQRRGVSLEDTFRRLTRGEEAPRA
ncbi:MAG: ATP-binding cassette domain-containing protein [Clostridia bacterium]|nr:ATP-binding cassette domain-containing protein [Deltaproteobacteria bacterium]